jgi:choline dehydrogenase-like flavoprotein
MFADGRTVPEAENVRADVCIVGAGPSGITVARALASAGVDVVLIERGDTTGVGTQEDLGNAVNVGIRYAIDKARGTGFGGALHKWLAATPLGDGFGRLREFAEDDFADRPWIPLSGWPFSKDELSPFYREARRWFDAPWPSDDPEPTWDRELGASIIASAQDELIRSEVFAFANPGIFAADYRAQLDRSERALVLTHATVTSIRFRDAADVAWVDVATETARFRVEARFFVLAAGAVENARILLASRERHACGVGNHHDLVGRYFMEHPRYTSGLLEPSPGLLSDPESWDIHLADGLPIQRKFRFQPDVCRRERLPNSIYFLRPAAWTAELEAARASLRSYRGVESLREIRMAARRARLPDQPIGRLTDLVLGLDAALASARRGRSNRSPRPSEKAMEPLTIEVMAEQVPDPDSRVTLHRERDRFGVPKAAVNWQLNTTDLHGAFRGQQLFAEYLVRQGLGRVHSLLTRGRLPYRLHNADHQMGTTRMDPDPRRGVVDVNGAVHDVHNLYVAGPSVFPTGGDANPTLTIVAMSLRLVQHLRGRLGR